MSSYATVADVEALWRPLDKTEAARAEELIPIITAALNQEAANRGRNLPEMIADSPDLALVAKSVTVDVVARTLMTSTNQEPMTQYSQSALGYSVSGTFLVPGGGLFIKAGELARLGLKRPRYGGFEPYEYPRHYHPIDKQD